MGCLHRKDSPHIEITGMVGKPAKGTRVNLSSPAYVLGPEIFLILKGEKARAANSTPGRMKASPRVKAFRRALRWKDYDSARNLAFSPPISPSPSPSVLPLFTPNELRAPGGALNSPAAGQDWPACRRIQVGNPCSLRSAAIKAFLFWRVQRCVSAQPFDEGVGDKNLPKAIISARFLLQVRSRTPRIFIVWHIGAQSLRRAVKSTQQCRAPPVAPSTT